MTGRRRLAAVAIAALLGLASATLEAAVTVYPEYPAAIERDGAYAVQVSQGKAKHRLTVYNHCEKSSLADRTRGGDVNRRFCEFAFDGAPVRVDIGVRQDVAAYKVFPSRLGLRHEFKDGCISVWLDRPEYFGIQLNDSDKTILSVFADAPERDRPDKGAPGVMYVEGWVDASAPTGVIETGDDVREIYVAPGAVLNARLKVRGKGTKLHGRGLLLDPMSDIFRYDQRTNTSRGFVVFAGEGCSADGIKLVDGRTFNFTGWAPDLRYTNVKVLSSMMCSDGFTNGDRNLLVDHAWIYCGDNALVISGVKGAVYRNVTIGTSCNAIFPQGSNREVRMENIDVFRADEGLLSNVYNGVLRRNVKWNEMSGALQKREPGPQDLEHRTNDFSIRNLSAVDCTLFSWFFRGRNTGTLPKTFVFDQVSIPHAAGAGKWKLCGKTDGVQVTVQNDLKRYLFTSNYTVTVTNLYLAGRHADGFAPSVVKATPDELRIEVRKDGAERRVPLAADRTEVKWTCPENRRVRPEPPVENLLEDRPATRSIWQRAPSWLVKFDAVTRDEKGAVVYRLTQCEKDAGMQAVITERFRASGCGTYRLSFDCKGKSASPSWLEAVARSNDKAVFERIGDVPRDGGWHRHEALLKCEFDEPDFDLLSLTIRAKEPTDEICLRNLRLVRTDGVETSLAPMPLGAVANASRLDRTAGDGKGGWIDLGSNDLHVLPSGRMTFCGVPFDIPADRGEADSTCIVLGRSGKAESARLPLPENPGPYLYLLHATADSAELKHERIGVVRIRYADGTSTDKSVRTARDVADWTLGKSFGNAFRAWTKYNDNMQVSLFASKFPIEPKGKPVSVEFKAYGQCPWMILAVTRGASRPLEAGRIPLELTKTFRTPPPRAKALPPVADGCRPRNVVLIIGDGMGEGAVDFTSRYCHGRPGALQMQRLPVSGHCTTVNVHGKTTDSAAAATAIATGSKTSNGMVGLCVCAEGDRKEEKTLVPFAQRAREKGLAVGILTSDRLTGATPAGFYAHVPGRGEAAKIAEQAAVCGYEILIGNAGTADAFKKTDMAAAGYVTVKTPEELKAAPKDAKVFGSIDCGRQENTLGDCMADVLGRLAANKNGFFLMAECATPDGGNHGNKPETSVYGVVQTDWMTAAALDFAAARGDTLVVVTADHETGRVRASEGDDGRAKISYGSTNHTEEPVALFAYGPGAERFKGTVDNTDIAKTVTKLLGL